MPWHIDRIYTTKKEQVRNQIDISFSYQVSYLLSIRIDYMDQKNYKQ